MKTAIDALEKLARLGNGDAYGNSKGNDIAIAALAQIKREEAQTAEPVTFDMLAHLARQKAFSEKTFGPGTRTKGVVDHIRKELLEIEASPSDLTEWIDVVILGLDGAWRAGGSPEDIVRVLVAKQTKNEGRAWPDWRTAPLDKAIEHVRKDDTAQTVGWIERDSFDKAVAHLDCDGRNLPDGTKLFTHPAPPTSADPVVKPLSAERGALIAELRGITPIDIDYSDMAELADRAADMLAADAQAVATLQAECDTITELNHAQWLALENVRTLAARRRKEEWAQHMLGFCDVAGNAIKTLRAAHQVAQQVAVPQVCPHCSHEQTTMSVDCGNCGNVYEAASQPPQRDKL